LRIDHWDEDNLDSFYIFWDFKLIVLFLANFSAVIATRFPLYFNFFVKYMQRVDSLTSEMGIPALDKWGISLCPNDGHSSQLGICRSAFSLEVLFGTGLGLSEIG
jgi:hypothetical protein